MKCLAVNLLLLTTVILLSEINEKTRFIYSWLMWLMMELTGFRLIRRQMDVMSLPAFVNLTLVRHTNMIRSKKCDLDNKVKPQKKHSSPVIMILTTNHTLIASDLPVFALHFWIIFEISGIAMDEKSNNLILLLHKTYKRQTNHSIQFRDSLNLMKLIIQQVNTENTVNRIKCTCLA